MLFIQKNLHHNKTITNSLIINFSTVRTQSPSSQNPIFMLQYLIHSCAFPLEQAIKASKPLTHINSPSNPDSIINFFKASGFNSTHITKIVTRQPRLLCSKVEKTLKPNFKALQELGFSEPELIKLVSDNPFVLWYKDLRPKIDYWRSLLGTNENLLKAFGNDNSLLRCSLSKKIIPNISFLRESGIPDDSIAKMVLMVKQIVGKNIKSIDDVIKWAEKLGVSRQSVMFVHAFKVLMCCNRARFDAKVEIFKSLGWSEEQVLSLVRTYPYIISFSEESIRSKMEFFVKEAGCEISYLVQRPFLFSFSLEGRLIPRYNILKLLKGGELQCGGHDFSYAMYVKEKDFMEKFVLKHKVKVKGILEIYDSCCAGKVPTLLIESSS